MLVWPIRSLKNIVSVLLGRLLGSDVSPTVFLIGYILQLVKLSTRGSLTVSALNCQQEDPCSNPGPCVSFKLPRSTPRNTVGVIGDEASYLVHVETAAALPSRLS